MDSPGRALADDHAASVSKPAFGHGAPGRPAGGPGRRNPAAIDPADPVSHALAVGGEEPEPISPELVLVCAELRRRALAALPDRDPASCRGLRRYEPCPTLY